MLASVELAKEKGAFPLFDAEQYLRAPRFASRLPDALKDGIRHARHAQQPPAVDRADRHDLARVRRQRVERHRAGLQLDLPAQEAHARRHDEGVRRRGPRLSRIQAHARPRRGRRARAVRSPPRAARRAKCGPTTTVRAARCCRPRSSRRWRFPRWITCAWARPCSRSSTRRSARRSTCRGLSVRRVQGPLPRGVEGGAQRHHHLSPERRAGRGARSDTAVGAGAAERSRHRRPGPPHPPRSHRRSRRSPACAGRAGRAAERQSVLDLRRSASARRLRHLRRPRRERTSRIRSKCGSTATSSRAAWARSPRRCRWTCARRTAPGST